MMIFPHARSTRRGLAAFLLLAASSELSSESVTLTTYYPAPSGIYVQMITVSNTYLARDGGSVAIGSAVPPSPGTKLTVMNGSVGIGTTRPSYPLDIFGAMHATGDVCTDLAGGRCLSQLASSSPRVSMRQAWGAITPIGNGSYMGTATCPPGYVATGGGFEWVLAPALSSSSKPSGDNAWTCACNLGRPIDGMSCYAICMKFF